jgi:hypothetical protein
MTIPRGRAQEQGRGRSLARKGIRATLPTAKPLMPGMRKTVGTAGSTSRAMALVDASLDAATT